MKIDENEADFMYHSLPGSKFAPPAAKMGQYEQIFEATSQDRYNTSQPKDSNHNGKDSCGRLARPDLGLKIPSRSDTNRSDRHFFQMILA